MTAERGGRGRVAQGTADERMEQSDLAACADVEEAARDHV